MENSKFSSYLLNFFSGKQNKTQMNRAMSWLLKTIGIEAKVLCQTRQRSQMVKLAELFLETAGSPAPNVETSFLSQLSRAAHSSRAATINQKPNQHRLLTILESLDFTEEVLRQPQYEVICFICSCSSKLSEKYPP